MQTALCPNRSQLRDVGQAEVIQILTASSAVHRGLELSAVAVPAAVVRCGWRALISPGRGATSGSPRSWIVSCDHYARARIISDAYGHDRFRQASARTSLYRSDSRCRSPKRSVIAWHASAAEAG